MESLQFDWLAQLVSVPHQNSELSRETAELSIETAEYSIQISEN